MNNSKKARTRQALIRDMLQKSDVIGIQEFCNKLDVSIATIRNDLTYLEMNGYLKRVLGGAISTEGTPRNTVYSSRINLYKNEKQRIAKYIVSNYIMPNMTIILDAGTTNHYIAEYLLTEDIPCKVLTNAFNVVTILSKSSNVEVYSAGGKLDKEHNAFHDPNALDSIKNHKVDIYFLSPNGIDSNNMITSSAEGENKIKKELMKLSKRLVIVADSSKFDKKANFGLADLSDVFIIITDKKLEKEKLKKYCDKVNIIQV